MQNRYKYLPILSIALLFISFQVSAQQSAYFEANATFRKALELYDQQQYASAAELFRQVNEEKGITGDQIDENGNISLLKADAKYYEIICGLELGNKYAESRLLTFIADNPESEKTKSALFHVGRLYYSKGNYNEALEWLLQVKSSNLAGADRAEYNFIMGYCYLQKQDDIRAIGFFKKAQTPQNPYTNDATYYYAHISFLNKDYNAAIREFEKLKNVPQYEDAYVYYKSQILLSFDKYDQAIALAEPAYVNGTSSYDVYLAKVLGSAYFNKENYAKAVEHFTVFLNSKHAAEQSTQDSYQIGYSYYKTDDYKNAIIVLEPLINSDDIWTQYAMYTLGDCFLKTDNKQNARAAFERAAKLEYDKKIQERALLQYAKLSYELGFGQFALTATQDFISKFPNSAYIDEARTLRGEVLLNSRNYAEALKVMESVQNRTTESNRLYQKVTYYRGAELYNAENYQDAIELFEKAVYYSEDRKFTAMANYWAGGAWYELRYFDKAIANYSAFVANEQASNTDIHPAGYYSLGYAHFQKENYAEAAKNFSKYLQLANNKPNRQTDARLRLADSYFVVKNYGQAMDNYNQTINQGQQGADYALYQKGMIEGLRGQQSNKIATMNGIISKYPNSSYTDDAQFEIANTYLIGGNAQQAEQGFNNLVKRYPKSSKSSTALMKIGLIHFNAGDDANALKYYKNVVVNYPSTAESREALQAIKNIYVDQGNAQAFIAYSKTVPNVNISQSTQDSISYQAAYSMYLKGDCDKGINAFNSYLSNFANGQFATEIHFYRAECLERLQRKDEALQDYLYIAGQTQNKYTERALASASEIYIGQANFGLALPLLQKLEANAEYKQNYGFAIVNLMRAYNSQNKGDTVLAYSEKVLDYQKASTADKNLAHLYAGKAWITKGNNDKALKELGKVGAGTKSIEAAEARYTIAEIQFVNANYANSKESCFEVINNFSNHDYWVAKAFVLLAENYAKEKNLFQARSTLQSIIDNYEGDDDVVETAKKKLAQINETASNEAKLSNSEQDTVDKTNLTSETDSVQN